VVICGFQADPVWTEGRWTSLKTYSLQVQSAARLLISSIQRLVST